jgi:hypothetical protein
MEFYKTITNNFKVIKRPYYITWEPAFSNIIIKLINKYSNRNRCEFISELINISSSSNNFMKQLDIFIIDKYFTFESLLGYGSNGAILLYKNINRLMVVEYYIFKFALEISDETSENESSIHYIIFNYQKNNNLKLVPDIETILMTKRNQDVFNNIKSYYHIMMERIDYDLSHFLKTYNPLKLINKGYILKWNIFLELLDQISSKLIVLQDKFKFMHNDLKCNNILVKYQDSQKDFQDIQFILCDLGGASYEFEENIYEGSVVGSDDKFNVCKDLFNFIHMLLSFSDHRIELIEFIEKNKLFELDKSLISLDENVWIKIYQYGTTTNIINNCYDPRILQEKMRLFK